MPKQLTQGQITVATVNNAKTIDLRLLPSMEISQEYTEETNVYLPDYSVNNLTIMPLLNDSNKSVQSIEYKVNGKGVTATTANAGFFKDGNNLKLAQNIGELDLGQVSTTAMTNKFLALESEILPIVKATTEIPAPANLLSALEEFNEAKYAVMQDIGIGNLFGVDADEFNDWTGGTVSDGVFSIVTPPTKYEGISYSPLLAPLEVGATYTVSFWAKSDADVLHLNDVYLISAKQSTNGAILKKEYPITNEWKYYTIHFVPDSCFEGLTDVRLRFDNNTRNVGGPPLTNDVTLQIKDVRLTCGVQPESANLLDNSMKRSGTVDSYVAILAEIGLSKPVENITIGMKNNGPSSVRLGCTLYDVNDTKIWQDWNSRILLSGEATTASLNYMNGNYANGNKIAMARPQLFGAGAQYYSDPIGDYDVSNIMVTSGTTAYSWRPSINDEETLIERSESTVTEAIEDDVISTTERDAIVELWGEMQRSYAAWMTASQIYENIINIQASAVIDSNTAPLEANLTLSLTTDVGSAPSTTILYPDGKVITTFDTLLNLYAKTMYGSYEQNESDLTYTWYKNDTSIVSRESSILVKANQVYNRTKYTCRTVTRKGRVSEGSIEVYPRLQGYTTDIVPSKGKTIAVNQMSDAEQTLTADVYHRGIKLTEAQHSKLSYQWYQWGIVGDNTTPTLNKIQGESSRTINIAPTEEIETYDVIISY